MQQNDNIIEEKFGEAQKFIEALTGSADSPVTFQTFKDHDGATGFPLVLHGTLPEHWPTLVTQNRAGHGIFVMVNAGDGEGRSKANVVAPRALFTDDDGKRQGPAPSTAAAPPSMVVACAHGDHTYWNLEPGEGLDRFTRAQQQLAAHFQTDPVVSDVCRVMRVPGFFHQKDPVRPYLVTIKETNPVRYTVDQVLAAFPGGISAANEPRRKPVAAPVSTGSLAYQQAREYVLNMPRAVEGDHGDNATFEVACALARDFRLPHDQALEIMKEWNEECLPPWSERDLEKKLDNAEKYGTGKLGSKLPKSRGDAIDNAICFVVPHQKYYARLPNGQWDLTAPMSKDTAKVKLAGLNFKPKKIADVFAYHDYLILDGVDCDPAEEPTFEREGRLYANNYIPSRIVPARGEYPRIQKMIDALTGNDAVGAAYVFNWMAAKYQNPGVHSMTALVFQGSQGLGKTKLGNIFGDLLGVENTASITQRDLDSDYNALFTTKLFVVADEVVNSDNLRQTASLLKAYITNPTVVVNAKYVNQTLAKNRMSFWFTSNSTTPVKVEGEGDRRYSVFSVFDEPAEDYKAMLRGIHNPDGTLVSSFMQEMQAFAYALKTHVVDYDKANTPYDNEARRTLVEASCNSAELFMAEIKNRGIDDVLRDSCTVTPVYLEKGYAVEAVYARYVAFCESEGIHPFAKSKFGGELKKAFPRSSKVKVTAVRGGGRVPVYAGLPRSAGAVSQPVLAALAA